jgi:hypothetical protein
MPFASIPIEPQRNTLGTLRFAPQFFEGFNFTHLASQIWQYNSGILKELQGAGTGS